MTLDLKSQFLRYAGFPFAYPFGMLFKERKHLFMMGNCFAFNDPSPDLINLSFSISQVFCNIFDL